MDGAQLKDEAMAIESGWQLRPVRSTGDRCAALRLLSFCFIPPRPSSFHWLPHGQSRQNAKD